MMKRAFYVLGLFSVVSMFTLGCSGGELAPGDLNNKDADEALVAETQQPLDLPSLTCTAGFQFNFSPPLDNNEVNAQLTGSVFTCVSPNGEYPNLQSATATVAPDTKAKGCSPVGLSIQTTGTIAWNTNETSDFTITASTDPNVQPVGLSAHIDSGVMAGKNILGAPLTILQSGVCGLGGVHSLTANLAAAIIY